MGERSQDPDAQEETRPYPEGQRSHDGPVASWLAERGASETDLAARYEIGDTLGRGGMADVHEARDRRLLRSVAMKTLRSGRTREGHIQAFLAEAQVTSQLEHPNIPPVHDVGVATGGTVFFTLKRVRGRTLATLIREDDPPLVRRLDLFLKVCDAVAYAHAAGVLHRDLKPANVMVGAFREVYVMDWGLAHLFEEQVEVAGETGDDDTTGSGRLRDQALLGVGTPGYMSPEQATGQADRIDERTDVYALGAILYFLLTGRRAFHGRGVALVQNQITGQLVPARRRDPSVSRELEAVASRALQVDPDARYLSVEALRDEVERYLGGLPVEAVRYSPMQRLAKWSTRHRRVVVPVTVTAGVGGLILVAVLAANSVRLAAARDVARDAERDAALRLADSEVALSRVYVETGRVAEARVLLAEAADRYRVLGASPVRADLATSALQLFHPPPELAFAGSEVLCGVAVAAAGDEVLVCTDDGRVQAFGAPWGERLATYPIDEGIRGIYALGSQRLALAFDEPTVSLFELGTGRVRFSVDLPELEPSTVRACLSRDASVIAIAGHAGTRAFSVASGQPIGPRIPAMWLAECSADGLRGVLGGPYTGSPHRSVTDQSVYDLQTGERLLRTTEHGRAALDSRGERYVVSTDDSHVSLWDVAGGEVVWSVPAHRTAYLAFVDEDRRVIAVGGSEQRLLVLDAATGERISGQRTVGGPTLSQGAAQASADGTRLLTLRVTDADLWAVPQDGFGQPGFQVGETLTALEISPDGTLVATTDWQGRVQIWDWRSRSRLLSLQSSGEGSREAAFAPDGAHLATADRDGGSRIYDVATGALLRTLPAGGDLIAMGVVPRADGSVVVVYEDGSLRIWDPEAPTWTELRGTLVTAWAVALAPDGRHLVVSGRSAGDPGAELWDLDAQRAVAASDDRFVAYRPAVDAQGARIAVPYGDGIVKVFAADDMRQLAELKRRDELLQSVAFSPDGGLLALGAYDGSLVLVETEGWTEVLALALLDRSIVDLGFVPGTRILIAGGGEGRIVAMDLDLAEVYARSRVTVDLDGGAPSAHPGWLARARAAAAQQRWRHAAEALTRARADGEDVGDLELVRAFHASGRSAEALGLLDAAAGEAAPATLARWRAVLTAP